jgi:hypothetical protein
MCIYFICFNIEEAPGVGASGVRSRSGGMSFTVNSSISTRCFHASGNEGGDDDEEGRAHTFTSTLQQKNQTSRNRASSSVPSDTVTESTIGNEKNELTKEQMW